MLRLVAPFESMIYSVPTRLLVSLGGLIGVSP